MADGSAAGAGGSTSLRELRPRLVAAAHQIAERQKQVVVNSISFHSSNIRSTFKPVIDGSVLKNDEKQRLVRERREEKKRQQDADKETHLLEKERKTSLRHKQQMEEKQRKLRERKEKGERRRIAAEEKRHQKDEALKEKFAAILHHTLEKRRLAIEYQQKRLSLGGSAMANSENKTEKTNKEKSLSLNRRYTKAHSSANTEQVEKKPGVPKYVMQYVTMPLPKCTSDELRAFMLRISAAKIPPQTKVEEFPSEEVETPPKTPPKSMDAPSPLNVDIISNGNIETIPTDKISEESIDFSSVLSVDLSPLMSISDSDTSSELSIEASSKVHLETVPKKSETDQQDLDAVAKKHVSYSECHTQSFSPANVCAPPSPVSSKSQIQKNQLSSPLPKQSKQSADPSRPYKMPLQGAQSMQSESSTDKNKKESQSDNKNKHDREIKKIFAKLRHIARRIEARQEEEKRQAEMQQRDLCDTCISSDWVIKKSTDVEKKEAELLEAEELLKPEDGQQQKETEEKKGWPDQEDQEAPLQEGDTKIEAQGEADKHKKEYDRIMSQNLKGRRGKKKRIEVMKRTRKTDVNASKVTTPCHDTYEEAKSTSEESDTDSLNEMFPSGKDPSSKLKMSIKNIKKMPPKLVFLRDSDSQVYKEPKAYCNSDLKTYRPKSAKDTSTQSFISRPSTKRMTSRTTKTRNADETNTTNRSSVSMNYEQQHICDKITNIVSHTRLSLSHFSPDSHKQNLDSMTCCQSFQTPLDDKRSSKPVYSIQLCKLFSAWKVNTSST
ncbi:MAP7 domain-containing protein 3 isoform X1 [Saimiri boliviensis]|uniref:MAP7 domain-containing protein 3 isoform X1 n=1 Tax=Saimiri boliviensis TaxID=27679 RepID=UPI003D78044E